MHWFRLTALRGKRLPVETNCRPGRCRSARPADRRFKASSADHVELRPDNLDKGI
jgi:hypothetical protein